MNRPSGKGGGGGVTPQAGRAIRDYGTALRAVMGLSALSAVSAPSALSQTDPRLVQVIRHAQEGQGDSARVKVQRLLRATPPGDTLYPQIVYTQAMVANDAADMRRQLQRVAIEYSSSSWADDALLRLVQLDYASANLDGAARNLDRIRLDYPDSPLIPQAAYWAARTYFDQKKPELACRWIAQGMTASSGNVELQNQLGYLNQRCSQFARATPQAGDTQASTHSPADTPQVTAALPADTARAVLPQMDTARTPPSIATAPPSEPAPAQRASPRPDSTPAAKLPPSRAGVRYRVQITAVRSVSTAQSIASKLKSRGFNPITVEEAGLYKVRVGDYATKAEAIAAVPDIKAKLGGSPFVVAGS